MKIIGKKMIRKEIINSIIVKKGDITKEKVDVIVNAANPSLLGGGGVDGAIHRAAGPDLIQECRSLGGCNFGEAKITKGYKLKTKHIIHTPGPIYKDGSNNEKAILRDSYWNSLLLAKENMLTSIAFPAISTGVYHYPKEEACSIAINTTIDFMIKNEFIIDVFFILYDDENFQIYTNFIKKIKDL